MAEPRFLDATIDQNDRPIGTCFLGNPETVNNGPVGSARFSTLRSWMSQWSPETNAHGEKSAANISVPILAIEHSADDAVPQPHTKRIFDAAVARGYREIEGAVLRENPRMLKFCESMGFTIMPNPDDPGERIALRELMG